MMDKEIIHASIYDPANAIFSSRRSDRARCTVVRCGDKDKCGLYARGECAYISLIGWHRCPYGEVFTETGFTRRARKYRVWLNERRERYKDVGRLTSHTTRLAIVGEYVFLPYAHMTMNESIPFLAPGGFLRKDNCFLPLENFTVETIRSIVGFHPHAVMGGEIRAYQEKSVPQFLAHLKEEMPDLYAEALKEIPGIKQRSVLNSVGRKAYLDSLKAGVVIRSGKKHITTWKWTGTVLESQDASVLGIPPGLKTKETRAVITPQEGQTVEITSEDQVDEDTQYAV
jgi:hypothetical protein